MLTHFLRLLPLPACLFLFSAVFGADHLKPGRYALVLVDEKTERDQVAGYIQLGYGNLAKTSDTKYDLHFETQTFHGFSHISIMASPNGDAISGYQLVIYDDDSERIYGVGSASVGNPNELEGTITFLNQDGTPARRSRYLLRMTTLVK